MIEVGSPVDRVEVGSLSTVRKVAAMLDRDGDAFREEEALPVGWHFLLMGADTRRSALREDGFPGLGVVMPNLGLPRLMLGGRSVTYRRDIPIGATVHRKSAMTSVVEKKSEAGPFAIATISHVLRVSGDDEPAVMEEQTYLLLGDRKAAPNERLAPTALPIGVDDRRKVVVPDDTLLFQFSALGFNSHKIHLDRIYAQQVEGFPDLVVNGGLITLLMTEFVRNDLGLVATSIKVRHHAPLYCNRPVTLIAQRSDESWRVKAFDDQNGIAVDMEVNTR